MNENVLPDDTTKPFLSGPLYDKLKFIALILLPAIGTLYFGLAGIWDLPNADKVVGSIVVVDTFLGVLLGLATNQYNNIAPTYNGFVNDTGADPDTGLPNIQFTITSPPDELLAGDVVKLKVEPSKDA